jgi:hypothetical protein
MENLRKRHLIVVDWCCMCKKMGETVDHFLLHYKVASALWSSLFFKKSFWVKVGHALSSGRSLCMLERAVW